MIFDRLNRFENPTKHEKYIPRRRFDNCGKDVHNLRYTVLRSLYFTKLDPIKEMETTDVKVSSLLPSIVVTKC